MTESTRILFDIVEIELKTKPQKDRIIATYKSKPNIEFDKDNGRFIYNSSKIKLITKKLKDDLFENPAVFQLLVTILSRFKQPINLQKILHVLAISCEENEANSKIYNLLYDINTDFFKSDLSTHKLVPYLSLQDRGGLK